MDQFTGAPVGSWKLYVFDDSGNALKQGNIISGWQLSIGTSAIIGDIPNQTTKEDVDLPLRVTLGDEQPGYLLRVKGTEVDPPTEGAVLKPIETTTARAGQRTVVISPKLNRSTAANNPAQVKLDVYEVNANGSDGAFLGSKTFNVTVTPEDDDPKIIRRILLMSRRMLRCTERFYWCFSDTSWSVRGAFMGIGVSLGRMQCSNPTTGDSGMRTPL